MPELASGAAGGFWSSGASILVVAAAVALLVAAALLLLLHRPVQRGVRARVQSFIPAHADGPIADAPDEPRRRSLVGALSRGRWWTGFVEAVAVSRLPKSPEFLIKRAAAIALVLAVLLGLVSGVPALGLLPLLAFPFVERWRVGRAAEKQRRSFQDTLPSYMQDMASAIRVGRSFVAAMAVVADSADEPTRSEFERAVTDESLGRSLEQSLLAVGERMHSRDVGQIAMIAELNRRSGSNVAEALDRVADGARDRADLRREMRALTAQSKMSSSVLTGMPVVLLLALTVIAPSYAHPLLHTPLGLVALAVGALLVLGGWKVMKKITDIGEV